MKVKSISAVQVCIRCGKMLLSKRGRKNCPYCHGLLRTRIMISVHSLPQIAV